MKIFIANESKQSLGGGWTFLRNFEKYGTRLGLEFIDVKISDELIRDGYGIESLMTDTICFISGATMVKRETIQKCKAVGMKIVLRVDNIPKNSRNRNTGTSRLFDYAQMADLVVYQSQWCKDYIGPWLKKDGPVIINGADHEIFNQEGMAQPKEGETQYLYAQYNRDEAKRWHEAWYDYILESRNHPSHLWIVGNFSPEQLEYNFDFFNGERFRYVGVLENPKDFAEFLRGTDEILLPYYNDACSNTMIEARLCGVKKIRHNGTGGNNEIMSCPLEELTAQRMAEKYMLEFQKLWPASSLPSS